MTTLGILGGGQLGRMLAMAATRMGVSCRFFDPDRPTATQGLGDYVAGSYDDPQALQQFAQGCEVVTTEFENVPDAAVRCIAATTASFPTAEHLSICQDRLAEKSFLKAQGIPTAPYRAVDSWEDLKEAAAALGFPCLLKTRRLGYDGKGQHLLRSAADCQAAWEALGHAPLILEGFVAFAREVSLIAVRGRDGSRAFYPLNENQHRQGILHLTLARPSLAQSPSQAQAELFAQRVLDAMQYVGVLVIEFFQMADGSLVANEMAPRVHNSGHWTIEGTTTSQFENHLRAILGWPLGDTQALAPFGMLNFIGRIPASYEQWTAPGAWVHHYGKAYKAGRKVGHLSFHAHTEDELLARAQSFAARLDPSEAAD